MPGKTSQRQEIKNFISEQFKLLIVSLQRQNHKNQEYLKMKQNSKLRSKVLNMTFDKTKGNVLETFVIVQSIMFKIYSSYIITDLQRMHLQQ